MSVKDEYKDEKWDSYANSYSRVNRVTQIPADRLVTLTDTLHLFSVRESYVLDSGAGDGVLTKPLSQRYPSIPILATDISSAMLSKIDATNLPNVTTQIVDA
jgi:trans-aconitate methyltransferase